MISDVIDTLFTCFLVALVVAGLAVFGFWIWLANQEYDPHSIEDFDEEDHSWG